METKNNFWTSVGQFFVKLGLWFWKLLCRIGKFVARIWRNPKGRTGLIMTGLLVLIAIFAPLIAPYDPYAVIDRPTPFQAPSWQHLLGTDALGRDVLSMVMYGAQISLQVGIFTALGVTFVGAAMGVLAGYMGGWVDTVIMRLVDVLLVIPSLPMMMLLSAAMGYSFTTLIAVFIILGWAGTARTLRAQVLSNKESNYVKAAQLAGAKNGYIMLKHILPSISNLLVMSTAMSCAGFMVAEAGLSFIGLGDPVKISWGKMITEAQAGFPRNAWWLIIVPGAAICYTVIGFMQIGLALEEIFNPRMGSANKIWKLFRNLGQADVDAAFASMDREGDEGYVEGTTEVAAQ